MGLAQANLIIKTDFDAKLSSLNRKITQNKTKHLLAENELNKLKTFDAGYFIGKGHFEESYCNANTKYISSWQSKRLSDEIIKPPTTSDNSLNPKVSYYGTKTRLKFRGSCLKQDKITFNH